MVIPHQIPRRCGISEAVMDFFDVAIRRIRKRARDKAGQTGDLKAAYQEAVAEYFMAVAEGQELDPLQSHIVDCVRRLVRRSGGEPVIIKRIAYELGRDEWWVWEQLEQLEEIGQVYRPNGKRKGWSVP